MASPRLRRLPAVVLAVVGLLAAGHIGATLVYTGPDTPVKQALQPGLNRYFLGPLDQGWNLFAPGPYSQDEEMLVRACLGTLEVCSGGADAGAEFTPWREVTAEEVAAVEGNVFANRESRLAKVVHGRLWPAASALTPEHREMAEANHLDGEPVFGVDLEDPAAVQAFGASELGDLRIYQRLEDTAVGLGTLYMIQDHGEEVAMVEVRLRRTAVVPFEQRHDPPAERTASWTSIGWRPATAFDPQVVAAWS